LRGRAATPSPSRRVAGNDRLKVLAPVLVTRLSVLAIGFTAVVTFGLAERPGFFASTNPLINLPARYDAGWYANISRNGYRWDGNAAAQQSVVFFPALPAFMSLVPGQLAVRLWAATLLSLVCFFVALHYIYGLARARMDEERALSSVWLLAAYPFAVFFGAAYTESLFLVSCVGAFYHADRGQAAPTAAWGLLAGFTRPNGWLLTPCLLLLRLRGRMLVAAALAPLLGVVLFSLYLYVAFGDPLAWLRAQQGWGRRVGDFWEFLVYSRNMLQQRGIVAYLVDVPFDIINAIAGCIALLMAIPVWRRFGLAYATFVVANIIPPLVVGGPLSLGRMSSVLFPNFLWLAAAVPASQRVAWVSVFFAGQAFVAAIFFTWRPLF
jgi:hypothetical protein